MRAHWLLVLVVCLLVPGCNDDDCSPSVCPDPPVAQTLNTAPLFRGIESVATAGGSWVQLAWAPASDDTTPPAAIRYRVFASTTGSYAFGAPVRTVTGQTSVVVSSSDTALLTTGQRVGFVVRAVDEDDLADDNEVEVTVVPVSAARVAYVDFEATTGGALGNLQDPFPSIQDAVDAVEAAGGGAVLVEESGELQAYAEQVRLLDTSADVLGIFGGFADFDTQPAGATGALLLGTRNPRTRPTRLVDPTTMPDPDLVLVENGGVPTMIDGFVIETGGTSVHGIDCDLQVSGCTLIDGVLRVHTTPVPQLTESGATTTVTLRVVGNRAEDKGDFLVVSGSVPLLHMQNNELRDRNRPIETDDRIDIGGAEPVFYNQWIEIPPSGAHWLVSHNLVVDCGYGLEFAADPVFEDQGGALLLEIVRNELRSIDSEGIILDGLCDVGTNGSVRCEIRDNLLVGVYYDTVATDFLPGTIPTGVDVELDVHDNVFLNGDDYGFSGSWSVLGGQEATLRIDDNLWAGFESDLIDLYDEATGTEGFHDAGKITVEIRDNVHPGGAESIYIDLGVPHGGSTDLAMTNNTILAVYDYLFEIYVGDRLGSAGTDWPMPDGRVLLTMYGNFFAGGYEEGYLEDYRDNDGSVLLAHIAHNVIGLNHDTSSGAGLYLERNEPDAIWLVQNNFFGAGGQDSEAGLYLDSESGSIRNLLRIENNVMALSHGAGLHCDNYGGQPQVVNNTLAYNGEYDLCGVEASATDQAFIHNCVLSHNALMDLDEDAHASYSLLRDPGGHVGWGNITGDPLYAVALERLFVSGVIPPDLFTLSPASPAIDAGDPHARYLDPDGSRNDMGAYGGPGAAPLGPVDPGDDLPFVFLGPGPDVHLFTGALLPATDADELGLVFNQAVDATTAAAGVTVLHAGTPVAGSWSTDMDGLRLVFEPADLPDPTAPRIVEVRIDTDLRNTLGQPLAYPHAFTFGLMAPAVAETEPNGSATQAEALAFGPAAGTFAVSGTTPDMADEDWFRFDGAAGRRLMATVVHRRAGTANGRYTLALHDASGALVRPGDNGVFDGDPYLDYVLTGAGPWFVVVQWDQSSATTEDYELILMLE